MLDLILIDGDQAIFLPTFGAATVVVQPGTLKARGPATLTSKKLCVDGDEKTVVVPGVTYIAPPYSIPGIGTLKIEALVSDQVAKKTNTGSIALMLKGTKFIAKFEVQSPAQVPPPASTPDATPQYLGQGYFVTTNTKFQAT